MPLTVLIADATTWFRDLVCQLLESTAKVCEAQTPEEALQLTRMVRPDVVVLGIEMHLTHPGLMGRLKAAFAATSVVLATGHGEEAYLNATGKSGADAFLPKHRARRELVSTIRTLAGRAARPWDGQDRRRPASMPTATSYLGSNRRSS